MEFSMLAFWQIVIAISGITTVAIAQEQELTLIPLYRYFNSELTDHITKSTATWTGPGFSSPGTFIGYGFNQNIEGTVPLYTYYSSNYIDHMTAPDLPGYDYSSNDPEFLAYVAITPDSISDDILKDLGCELILYPLERYYSHDYHTNDHLDSFGDYDGVGEYIYEATLGYLPIINETNGTNGTDGTDMSSMSGGSGMNDMDGYGTSTTMYLNDGDETVSTTPEPTEEPTEEPTVQPTQHPVSATTLNTAGCDEIDGGGWKLVRHVSSSFGAMHPAGDNLLGMDVYNFDGYYDNDAQSDATWSIEYVTEEYNQFLFAYGDCSTYLVTTVDQVLGENYSNEDRCIIASSIEPDSESYAKWYYREGAQEEPWISVKDHAECINFDYEHMNIDSGIDVPCMVYGEYGWNDDNRGIGFELHNGGNVWIRYRDGDMRCS